MAATAAADNPQIKAVMSRKIRDFFHAYYQSAAAPPGNAHHHMQTLAWRDTLAGTETSGEILTLVQAIAHSLDLDTRKKNLARIFGVLLVYDEDTTTDPQDRKLKQLHAIWCKAVVLCETPPPVISPRPPTTPRTNHHHTHRHTLLPLELDWYEASDNEASMSLEDCLKQEVTQGLDQDTVRALQRMM